MSEKTEALVQEAIDLQSSISALEKRLDDIKKSLILLAEKQKLTGHKTDGGGVSVVLGLARVVFPGPTLISSIKKTDANWGKISEACGEHFRRLFRPSTTAKPIEDFREVAKELIGEKADKLIALCEKESKPTVSFETTERFEGDWP